MLGLCRQINRCPKRTVELCLPRRYSRKRSGSSVPIVQYKGNSTHYICYYCNPYNTDLYPFTKLFSSSIKMNFYRLLSSKMKYDSGNQLHYLHLKMPNPVVALICHIHIPQHTNLKTLSFPSYFP